MVNDYRGMSDDQIAEYEAKRIKCSADRDEAKIKKLADEIRETAFAIHKYFGIGYLEKVYENTLKHRLEKAGHNVRQQMPIGVYDEDGFKVGFYEADLVVDGMIILELKAVKQLCREHEAQLINYLKTTSIKDGMLINFGSAKFEILKRAL